jgi:hypothetical protein
MGGMKPASGGGAARCGRPGIREALALHAPKDSIFAPFFTASTSQPQ